MPENVLEYQKVNGQVTDFFTVLPAQVASSATRTSNIMYNPMGVGMILTIVTADETGAASFTPTIKCLDAFGTVVTLWTAAAAITAAGTFNYAILPGSFTNTSFTEVASSLIPRKWYLVLTYSGTPANDYISTKASACFI